MSKYHCLHDAPRATYQECFCGKCKKYGTHDEMFGKECPADIPCHCNPITENPDVQRLISQTVQLQAENKRLKEALKELINSIDLLSLEKRRWTR